MGYTRLSSNLEKRNEAFSPIEMKDWFLYAHNVKSETPTAQEPQTEEGDREEKPKAEESEKAQFAKFWTLKFGDEEAVEALSAKLDREEVEALFAKFDRDEDVLQIAEIPFEEKAEIIEKLIFVSDDPAAVYKIALDEGVLYGIAGLYYEPTDEE